MDSPVAPRVSARIVASVIVADRRSYVALYAALAGLSEDQLVDLIAISWIGEGRFAGEEFSKARPAANGLHRGSAAKAVLGTPKLDDLLEGGLSALLAHAEEKRWEARQASASRPRTKRAVEAYS
jgi:hypothetical protein